MDSVRKDYKGHFEISILANDNMVIDAKKEFEEKIKSLCDEYGTIVSNEDALDPMGYTSPYFVNLEEFWVEEEEC